MKYLYKWHSFNNGVSRIAVVVNPDHPGADYGLQPCPRERVITTLDWYAATHATYFSRKRAKGDV